MHTGVRLIFKVRDPPGGGGGGLGGSGRSPEDPVNSLTTGGWAG